LNCTGLAEIHMPSSIKYLGKDVFENTDYLKNAYTQSGGIYCENILIKYKEIHRHVEVLDGTRVIAGGAFYQNPYLETVALPPSIRGIGEAAFAECPNLKEIELPENMEYIGSSALSIPLGWIT